MEELFGECGEVESIGNVAEVADSMLIEFEGMAGATEAVSTLPISVLIQ